eukprot:scaffold614_cov367-Prasinococcus_capsulatus_cf.AAC.17
MGGSIPLHPSLGGRLEGGAHPCTWNSPGRQAAGRHGRQGPLRDERELLHRSHRWRGLLLVVANRQGRGAAAAAHDAAGARVLAPVRRRSRAQHSTAQRPRSGPFVARVPAARPR